MAKYRKKPVVIEAVQWHNHDYGDTLAWEEFPDWLTGALHTGEIKAVFKGDVDYWELEIKTLEGTMKAGPGDWIVRGVKGELYPVKPDIFAETYELQSPSPSATRTTLTAQRRRHREDKPLTKRLLQWLGAWIKLASAAVEILCFSLYRPEWHTSYLIWYLGWQCRAVEAVACPARSGRVS